MPRRRKREQARREVLEIRQDHRWGSGGPGRQSSQIVSQLSRIRPNLALEEAQFDGAAVAGMSLWCTVLEEAAPVTRGVRALCNYPLI